MATLRIRLVFWNFTVHADVDVERRFSSATSCYRSFGCSADIHCLLGDHTSVCASQVSCVGDAFFLLVFLFVRIRLACKGTVRVSSIPLVCDGVVLFIVLFRANILKALEEHFLACVFDPNRIRL